MTWQIKAGDARAVLSGEAAGSVQTVCTSPPFYGLRAYQTEPQIWGGALNCAHDWTSRRYYTKRTASTSSAAAFTVAGPANADRIKAGRWRDDTTCSVCGAWRGELGSEPTVDLYVAHLVDVFRAVKRVLRPDGTCWVNLGDSFSHDSKWGGYSGGVPKQDSRIVGYSRNRQTTGLGDKQLLLVPARFALAMQGDGWILRQAITWCKTAPMPESVQDRPTSATEMIYLFSQQPRYYFDAAAIAEPTSPTSDGNRREFRGGGAYTNGNSYDNAAVKPNRTPGNTGVPAATRNSWNYWLIGPAGSTLPHYAMFPPEIPRRCILAGTSAYGACARCGAPWRRQTERDRQPRGDAFGRKNIGDKDHGQAGAGYQETIRLVTKGWAPGCACGAAVVPCRVLDPFSGAGTTIQEAARLGRDGLGIELLPANVELSRRRIIADCPLFNMPQEATA